MNHSTSICIADRFVAKNMLICPHCHSDLIYMGKRWRAPRKNNDRAWKLIESGDFLWDKKHIEKKRVRKRKELNSSRDRLRRWRRFLRANGGCSLTGEAFNKVRREFVTSEKQGLGGTHGKGTKVE